MIGAPVFAKVPVVVLARLVDESVPAPLLVVVAGSGVLSGVGLGVGVAIGVGLAVGDGVGVSLGVGVGVPLGVGVAVGVGVGVRLGVAVGVGVGAGVGVASWFMVWGVPKAAVSGVALATPLTNNNPPAAATTPTGTATNRVKTLLRMS